jgi:NAD-dependent deacetylase
MKALYHIIFVYKEEHVAEWRQRQRVMIKKPLREILSEAKNIVFFGGAGTSTESNIPDFRSVNGLYQSNSELSYSPEQILSRSFFVKHTAEFYKFYRKNMIYLDAKPNIAHFSLVELEKRGQLKAVVTQNIDGLHQSAVSTNVLELHGSIHRNFCMRCDTLYDIRFITKQKKGVPTCERCGGIVKPDVTLYEESLNMDVFDKAKRYIMDADLLVVGGTSLSVQPAASLVNYYQGEHIVIINHTETNCDGIASYLIRDSIGNVLNQWVNEVVQS